MFLNSKSVSRVKSVFRGMKCLSMSDPFAPRVDLCCPSLRGPTKIHKWSKWITNGETFLYRGKLISRMINTFTVKNYTLFNFYINYETFLNQESVKIGQKSVKIGRKSFLTNFSWSWDQAEFFEYPHAYFWKNRIYPENRYPDRKNNRIFEISGLSTSIYYCKSEG